MSCILRVCRSLCASWGLLLGALAPAWAVPQLRCDVTYAGATQVVRASPVSDPYGVAAVDIRGRFRFKAVMVGDGQRIERINLYVYQNTPEQPVLVQQAKYLPPFSAAGSAAPGSATSAALTGQQHVYAGPMQRELIYSCALEGMVP